MSKFTMYHGHVGIPSRRISLTLLAYPIKDQLSISKREMRLISLLVINKYLLGEKTASSCYTKPDCCTHKAKLSTYTVRKCIATNASYTRVQLTGNTGGFVSIATIETVRTHSTMVARPSL